MKQEHLEFIDFALKWLYDKEDVWGDGFDTISYRYKQKTGIDYNRDLYNKIIRICEDDNLIQASSNNGMYRLTPKTINIILEYDSYLNFIKSQNNYIDRQKEIEDLNIELNKLQIENTKLNNRKLKRDLLFSIVGFIIAVIVTNWKDILILMKLLPPE